MTDGATPMDDDAGSRGDGGAGRRTDDRSRQERIEEAFDAAIAVPAEERAAVVASFGLEDGARREVLDLLRFHREEDARAADDPEADGAARTLVGATLGGCTLEALVGIGGMGAVYRARQASPARTVAVKVVDEGARSAGTLRRFRNEAEILSQLEHPGIARIYAMGTHRADDGATWPFIVMEFVEGARAVTAAFAANGAASAADLRTRVATIAEVAEAVAFGHGRGVIHRDLKPANILVDRAGRARVIDFGIAKAVARDEGAGGGAGGGETLRTQFLGTPQYMAPEQFVPGAGSADVRVDIHALGLILHELVAGEPLYRIARGAGLVEAATVAREAPRSRLRAHCAFADADLEAVVAKATAREAGARYASMAEFAADLRAWLAGEPVAARPERPLGELVRLASRHRVAVAGVAGGLLALVAAAVVSFVAARTALRESEAARVAAARSNLRAAAAAFDAGSPADAVAEIERVPTDLRGWESRHLLAAVGNFRPIERTDVEIIDLCAIDGADEAVLGVTGGWVGLVDLGGARPTEWIDLREFHRTGLNRFFHGIDATRGGRRVVVTMNDRSVIAIDRDRDEVRRIADGPMAAFATEDAILLVEDDGAVRRVAWSGAPIDGAEGAAPRLVEGAHTWIADFERSRDRSRLAFVLGDGSIRVVRVGPGEGPRVLLQGDPVVNGTRAIDLSPDGATAYAVSNDGRISAWDVGTGALIAERDLPGGTVYDLRASRDGRVLAASSWADSIRVIDARTLEISETLGGTSSHVWGIDFLPGGELIGRCVIPGIPSDDWRSEWLAAWRIGDSIAVDDRDLGRRVVRAAAIEGTARFAILDEHGLLSELDTASEREIAIDAACGERGAIAATDGLCAVAGADGEVVLHERRDGAWRRRWSARPLSGVVTALGIAPDGRTVGVGTASMEYAALDAADGAVRWRDAFPSDAERVNRQRIGDLVFTDRGATMTPATVTVADPLRFHRSATGARVAPDGRHLLPEATDAWVRRPAGDLFLMGYTGVVFAVAADGREDRLAACRNGGSLTGSGDGARLFTATRDGAVRVLATDPLGPLLRLDPPAGRVVAIGFDDARDSLAVVTTRGTVRVWKGRVDRGARSDEPRGVVHALANDPALDPDAE